MLSYKCCLIWLYNDNGDLIDNKLPEELNDDMEIKILLADIQKKYDSLFINNKITFEYKGFENELERQSFLKKIEQAVINIKNKIGNIYIIENKIDSSEL